MDGIGSWILRMMEEPAFVAALLAPLAAFVISVTREWMHDRDLENRRHRAMVEARERVGFLRDWLEAQDRASGGATDAGVRDRAREQLERTYRETAELLAAPALQEPRRVRSLFRSVLSARREQGNLAERLTSLMVVVPLTSAAAVLAQLVYVGTWLWGIFWMFVALGVLVDSDELSVGATVGAAAFSLLVGWGPAWLVRLTVPALVPQRVAPPQVRPGV